MKKLGFVLIVLISCIAMAACGDYVGNNTATSETGNLSLGLTDAATDEYKAVYITIDEIQVHMGGDEEDTDNWETVATPMETYNLLELVNGVIEGLGFSPLEAGPYEQMRLIIGTIPAEGLNILSVGHPYANYVIDDNNQTHELKIPSGINTGIKIVHGFDISAEQTTELILDFNSSASVVKAGNSGNWLLKPTIKVLDTQEYAIVSGIVSDTDSQLGIEGALVSLQYEDPDAEDEKDAVTVQAATVSDEEDTAEGIESGDFSILVQPGSYRLVAYKDEYAVGCAAIETEAGETTVQDVELATAAMGTIEGNVLINGSSADQYATLSFRRLTTWGDAEATVEVRCVNILHDYSYTVSLPVGTYSLVASTSNMETEVYDDLEVTDSSPAYQDVAFGY